MANRKTPEYKRAGYLLPDVIDPQDCICVCVPVPDEPRHIQAFKAQIFALSRWWSWERDDAKRGKDAAAVWAGIYECVEWRMDNNCGCGGGSVQPAPIIRFDEDGNLEASYDNGLTWELAPQLDTRLTTSRFPPLPGVGGDEKRCNAAWAAAKVIEDDIIQKLKESDIGIALVSVIAGVLAIYLSGGALAPLVVSLVGAALAAGSNAIEAAFTAQVWADFRCILYCTMEDDASFTVQGWQQTKAEINNRISGIAGNLLYNTVEAFGAGGMSNAARSKRAGGTGCDSCYCDDTWCYQWNFLTDGDGEWTKVTELGYNFGVYTAGQGWVHSDKLITSGNPDAAYRAVVIKRELSAYANFTRIVIDYEITKGTYSVPSSRGLFLSAGPFTAIEVEFAGIKFDQMVNGVHQFEWTGSLNANRINVHLRSSQDNASPYAYSGACKITAIRMQGSGANPFAQQDNCV